MFKINDRFIIRSYVGPLAATFFVCVFILLMQFLWRYIDDIVGKGLEVSVIAELLLYASAQLVPMALPLAILLASIMTFGNLGEHNELMAMKAAGIPLPRIMRPLIIFNIILAFAAFGFSNYLLPYTNLKMGALLYDIRQQRPEMSIKEGVFYDGVPGITIKVQKKNLKTNMLHNLMIYDHREASGNLNITLADSGSVVMSKNKQYLVFTLYDGEMYEDMRAQNYSSARDKTPFRRQKFHKQEIYIETGEYDFSRTSSDLFKNNYQMLNLKQLDCAIDSLQEEFRYRQKVGLMRIFDSGLYLSIRHQNDVPCGKFNLDSAFSMFSEANQRKTYESALNYARLASHRIENLEVTIFDRREWIAKHEIEWHKKFTLSVACLLFFFIGAPFGAIVRKGGIGIPVLVSMLFFLFYYIVTMMSEKSVKLGEVYAVYGVWKPSIILFFIGLFLIWRATTDSAIINTSWISDFIRKYKKQVPVYEKFGEANSIKPLAQYSQSMSELSDSLGNYAEILEKNRIRNRFSCALFDFYEPEKYYEISRNYYSLFSEYSQTSDVDDYLFIKEQLDVMPTMVKQPRKVLRYLSIFLSIITLGIYFWLFGYFRGRYVSSQIVKIRSHILTILSFKSRRGLE